MSTPSTISTGVRKLFNCPDGQEGVPSSRRIEQDCERVWESMLLVHESCGAMVPDLSDRNGHRYSSSGTGKRGGKRVKSEMMSEKWLEPGAKKAKIDLLRSVHTGKIFLDDSNSEAEDESVSSDISNESRNF